MEVPEDGGAVVVRDTFPASVTVGDTSHDTARAVVTRRALYVWVVRDGQPHLVEEAPYDLGASRVPPLNASRARATVLSLDDGRQVHITRAPGCGCNNPLRHMTPWAPYRKGTL